MVTTLENHVSVLESFLSNSASTAPEQAAEAAFHITRAAAQSASPKPAVALAQTVLVSLSTTPCKPAIPYLLSICENDPFEALDVFVLSSAAWKAVVAAAIAAPPEPHLAMRIISCAALNATAMIIKCLQPSTRTSSEVVRTVKIAKFYCLNAARCSRAFSSSIQHLPSNLISAPCLHLLDLLALSSFVLLFEHQSMLPAHHELQTEVLPLATRTLKTILVMTHNSLQKDRLQAIRRALDTTGKHQKLAQLLLPTTVLRLIAVLHASRCALDTKQQPSKSQEPEQISYATIISLLMPYLFDCLDMAYEEVILLREQGGRQAFLDVVSSTTADIASRALFGVICAIRKQEGLDFLLGQVTSDNPIRSHIAQDVLLHMAKIGGGEGGWRDLIAVTVFACFRTSLALSCDQIEKWQQLSVNLSEIYVHERKRLNDLLVASQKLCSASASRGDPSTTLTDDPVPIFLLAQLCEFMSRDAVADATQDTFSQSQMRSQVFLRTLEVFQMDSTRLAEQAQDLALTSIGLVAVNAISLLPHVLDSKSVCGAALSVLQRESSTPPMICAALNILNPSAMQPATVDAVCTAGTSVVDRYGTIVCPAISAFVSKAACCVGETVSLAHWQQLSTLLESCVITSQEAAELDPPVSYALAGIVLYYAAFALTEISNPNRGERQTQATLPKDIVTHVHDVLKRLESCRSGEDRYDQEEVRALVREERYWSDMPSESYPSSGMNALYSIQEARARILEATSLLLHDSNLVCLNEEMSSEFSLLQDSISSIMRCKLPPRH